MKQYTIGLITGALLAISAMMFMAAQTFQDKNLGDITADSITLISEAGLVRMDGKGIRVGKRDDVHMTYLSATGMVVGIEHAPLVVITSEGGGGILKTYNAYGKMTGYFGTNTENDGLAILYDRYGDIGWAVSGKQ